MTDFGADFNKQLGSELYKAMCQAAKYEPFHVPILLNPDSYQTVDSRAAFRDRIKLAFSHGDNSELRSCLAELISSNQQMQTCLPSKLITLISKSAESFSVTEQILYLDYKETAANLRLQCSSVRIDATRSTAVLNCNDLLLDHLECLEDFLKDKNICLEFTAEANLKQDSEYELLANVLNSECMRSYPLTLTITGLNSFSKDGKDPILSPLLKKFVERASTLVLTADQRLDPELVKQLSAASNIKQIVFSALGHNILRLTPEILGSVDNQNIHSLIFEGVSFEKGCFALILDRFKRLKKLALDILYFEPNEIVDLTACSHRARLLLPSTLWCGSPCQVLPTIDYLLVFGRDCIDSTMSIGPQKYNNIFEQN
jgi:hypothetical protein